MKIPKLIHQIWWQGENLIPKKYREYRKSWLENHKTWKLNLWDRIKFENLLKKINNSFLNQIYIDLPNMIQKIDFAKYVILDKFGGAYVDMDTYSERPIDKLIINSDSGLILSKLEVYSILKLINNGIIISIPDHPFYTYLFKEIYKNRKQKFYQNSDWYIMDSTGPLAFSNAVMYYLQAGGIDIKILDDSFLESCKMTQYGTCPKKGLYITHYHDCSWCSEGLLMHFRILKNFSKHRNKIIILIVFIAILLNIFYLYII